MDTRPRAKMTEGDIRVGELGEDPDIGRVLKLGSFRSVLRWRWLVKGDIRTAILDNLYLLCYFSLYWCVWVYDNGVGV